MALKNRQTTRSLKDDLYEKPYEFEFVQAVRLMHLLSPEATPLGTSGNPEKEPVEFKSRAFLSAPPSDLFKIIPALQKEIPEDGALGSFSPPQVFVNFLGIAGIQGPLPLPYTESLLNHIRQKDMVFRDFLDIFNHRLLSLYYRIEQKFSPFLSLTPPEETHRGHTLKSLIGWAKGGENLPFSPRNLLFYASFFWQKPHNPYALKTILQTHFNLPVEIVSFQGAWMCLPPLARTHLGGNLGGGGRLGQQNKLGESAVLGNRVWCQHHHIVVNLRVKQFQDFQQFLPFGPRFSLLTSLVSFYLGPAFSFKIGLFLDKKPASHLGNGSPFYLGWTSWLGREPASPTLAPRDLQVVLRPEILSAPTPF